MTGTDKVELLGARMRTQRTQMHAARLERRERVLRERIEDLQAELDRQRAGRQELLNVMRNGRNGMSMIGGTFKLLLVGGVAYVLGTKAGRERYDQIVTLVRRTKDDGERKVGELAEAVSA